VRSLSNRRYSGHTRVRIAGSLPTGAAGISQYGSSNRCSTAFGVPNRLSDSSLECRGQTRVFLLVKTGLKQPPLPVLTIPRLQTTLPAVFFRSKSASIKFFPPTVASCFTWSGSARSGEPSGRLRCGMLVLPYTIGRLPTLLDHMSLFFCTPCVFYSFINDESCYLAS